MVVLGRPEPGVADYISLEIYEGMKTGVSWSIYGMGDIGEICTIM